ncbi:HlyD family type I secretion periplasmic adaptor subunit [Enterovibrio norvegicus]|uniref:HlyD family type I secretion periplasmic adaptor subunit n=1 Tax=Enterovibrio norvegicus TaxID=188144 RepID=UPI003554558B
MVDNSFIDVSAQQDVDNSLNNHKRTMWILATVLILLLGGWAGFQQISGAVIGSGVIVVESNAKQVQHPKGGVVSTIYVDNGDEVKAGQPIVFFDSELIEIKLTITYQQLVEQTAKLARLEAEKGERPTIDFPLIEGQNILDQQEVDDILASEHALFRKRRESLMLQSQRLEEQISSLNLQIDALEAKLIAKNREANILKQQVGDTRKLHKKQYVSKDNLHRYERELLIVETDVADAKNQVSRTRQEISETLLALAQIDTDHRTEVLAALHDTRYRIGDLRDEYFSLTDELKRVVIKAPVSGYIHNLAVHTQGAVVTSGQVIMEIIPKEDNLIVEAQIAPKDIDQIHPGQVSRVRFPSFNQKTTPDLLAELSLISPDLVQQSQEAPPMYMARLKIGTSELEKLNGKSLIPGMPVEVFITTEERSVMSYLMKPIVDQIQHSMRER